MSFDHSGGGRRRDGAAGVVVSLLAWAASPAASGQAQQTADDAAATSVNADENGPEESTRRMVHWNEYEGRWFTARLGGGFLYDNATASEIVAQTERALSSASRGGTVNSSAAF